MAERTFTCFYLKFPNGLHLSKGNGLYDVSEEMLHSDTLHAALVAVAAAWGQDVSQNAPYLLSSAFPFIRKDAEILRFFPKPYIPLVEVDAQRSDLRKKLKSIQWFEQSLYEELLHGKTPAFDLDNDAHSGYVAIGGIPFAPYRKKERVRTRVGRVPSEDTRPYYVDELEFTGANVQAEENVAYGGLFFLAETSDDNALEILMARMKMLQDEGLGTDRAVGKGQFEFTTETIKLRSPDNHTHLTNLGLYLPESKDQLKALLGEKHQYSLRKRGGWITTGGFRNLRKKEVMMFDVAGVFSSSGNAQDSYGRIADVTPNAALDSPSGFKVLRDGRSLFLPLQMPEQ